MTGVLLFSLFKRWLGTHQAADYIPPVIVFVCVEILRPSQPNGVMLSAVSLHNHTFTG